MAAFLGCWLAFAGICWLPLRVSCRSSSLLFSSLLFSSLLFPSFLFPQHPTHSTTKGTQTTPTRNRNQKHPSTRKQLRNITEKTSNVTPKLPPKLCQKCSQNDPGDPPEENAPTNLPKCSNMFPKMTDHKKNTEIGQTKCLGI